METNKTSVMDAKNIRIGFNTVLSLMVGVSSALTVWFTLQGDVNINKMKIVQLETQDKKHDLQFKDVNYEYKELTKTLNDFKIEIIKAIQEREKNGR